MHMINKTDKLNNYRMNIAGKEFIPLIQGGMGVDISTKELALTVASCGGIGTISDAMIQAVSDKNYQTTFTRSKRNQYKESRNSSDKSAVKFDLNHLYEAQSLHIKETMKLKSGPGDIFVNVMEKLTMNASADTLSVRLHAALDAGIDGITLSAGLHLKSFKLIQDNPRFRKAKLGIIISSVRALSLFLRKSKRTKRLPDFIIVEGPMAGGHLGFGEDWKSFSLMTLTQDINLFLKEQQLAIPVIAAGGVFTGSDAVGFILNGAAGVQVATRFTVSKESGLPEKVKQQYFKARESDIVVNNISPTGYLMRMLKASPAINSRLKPNCEALGYILDDQGKCSYVEEFNQHMASAKLNEAVMQKTCLCSNMLNFSIWTCGQTTYRLKDTSVINESGQYQLLDAKTIFEDYQYGINHEVKKPIIEKVRQRREILIA